MHSTTIHICLRSLALLGLDVGLNIELGKEEEETQDVNEVDEDDAEAGLLALGGEEVGGLAHHGDELDHLHEGEVGLPPDGEGLAGLVVLGVHADEVVGVHDGVDEAVEEDGEVDVSVVVDVGVEPVEEEDGGVVVNVEEGELAPLLADDDEDGVPEVPDLYAAKIVIRSRWHMLVRNGNALKIFRGNPTSATRARADHFVLPS